MLLYFVNDPWNVFYLLPFFVFGYYVRDLRFSLSRGIIAVLCGLFIIGLCYWSPDYTPWKVDAMAWRTEKSCIGIYVYRTVLGCVGVVVMGHIMVAIRGILGGTQLESLIVNAGRETLAIYVLQSIAVEGLLRKGCYLAYNYVCVRGLDGGCLNLIGYVIAPVVSLFSIGFLLRVVKVIRSRRYTSWFFGFKV